MNILKNKRLTLGSQSPRRKFLLETLDLTFDIRIIEVEEIFDSKLSPKEIVEYLAKLKSQGHQKFIQPNNIVLTADTIVSIDGEILGKPKNEEDAYRMLSRMSARWHDVYTGVCLLGHDKIQVFSDLTRVKLMELSNEEMGYYINNYQPFDKAGSYGIQEWIGYAKIESLEGSYANVMGLPVHLVYEALKSF